MADKQKDSLSLTIPVPRYSALEPEKRRLLLMTAFWGLAAIITMLVFVPSVFINLAIIIGGYGLVVIMGSVAHYLGLLGEDMTKQSLADRLVHLPCKYVVLAVGVAIILMIVSMMALGKSAPQREKFEALYICIATGVSWPFIAAALVRANRILKNLVSWVDELLMR